MFLRDNRWQDPPLFLFFVFFLWLSFEFVGVGARLQRDAGSNTQRERACALE